MHCSGEVWYLPPEARVGGDPKTRRHVLLTPCDEEDDVGVFAYASRAGTEAAFGGAAFFFNRSARRALHAGFDAPTYVMPCRLVAAGSEDLIRKTGRIVDEMREIRRALHRALGIGTRTRRGGPAAGSLRGCLVELAPPVADEIGTRAALLVTEPGYSLQRRYQLVLPLLDPDEYEPSPGDVLVEEKPWISAVEEDMRRVLVAVPMIQAAFHPTDLARVVPAVVDDATIAAVDRALLALFGL
ncbi:MAG TPA: hypothetical protein VHG91_01420 [Longimicrobium sp.]|nr:hypothetical protein [Longimicrobium sp.]